MGTVILYIWRFIKSLGPLIAQIVIGTGVSIGLSVFVNGYWGVLFAKLDAMSGGVGSTSDFSPLSIINYVYPLDATLSFLVLYMSISGTCALIRIIRAHIPKTNNG